MTLATLALVVVMAQDASFEVATIKPTAPDDRSGRFATMQSTRQFVVKSYSLKYLVSFAYNIPPRLVSGGPTWTDIDLYDIRASTPGDKKPSTDEQMGMVRNLLKDRFKLTFHREKKEMPVYVLSVAKNGAKLKESTAAPDAIPALINVGFPGEKIQLPAKNVTMPLFTGMLQRAVLDRPVVDNTGLTGRYDFDLEWTYDETQFDGKFPPIRPDADRKADLFTALQQQLGLKLEAGRGSVDVLVIDKIQRPSEN